jgi:hypothetical protein
MPKHVALNRARRLKRVFGIGIERRERGEEGDAPTCSLGARAPPQAWLF